MARYNPENERIKRAYFVYLKEARRHSDASVAVAAKALHRFEDYTRFKPFKAFHREQAVGFKRKLAEQRSSQSGETLSKATLYSTLQALRNFFLWLAGQPGFKKRIAYSDADYFNLSGKETRIAKTQREQRVPTLDQIFHVLAVMPTENDIQRRNRALIAFGILTGARDGALASISLKHVDLAEGRLIQDAREVRTKFSKTFPTWFFPVGEAPLAIVTDWIEHLRRDLLWGGDDPLFPATKVAVGPNRRFEAAGLDRRCWTGATPIRKIFRDAFAGAGLPYFNPHSFRKTLAQLGEERCGNAEELKAWSQNLGHEDVLTTLRSYGSVAPARQAEIIRAMAHPVVLEPNLNDIFMEMVRAEAAKLFGARAGGGRCG